MTNYTVTARFTVALSVLLFAFPARASFHLWEIQEVYSNSDGSVQFIELFTTFNGQQVVNNRTITTLTDGNTFTFPNAPSPSPTANHHLLFATPGFDGLVGGVTPDYTIPANFFDPLGDTINFVSADSVTFASAPTDNVNSLHFPIPPASGDPTVATNSPTNYAGDAGSLLPPILAGDYNDDDVVDIRDYTAWRDNLGAAAGTLPNDEDGGEIRVEQYITWTKQFGEPGAAALASSVVPEPASGTILAMLAVATIYPNLRRTRN